MLICDISLINKEGKEKLNKMLKSESLDWHDLVTLLVIDYYSSTNQIKLAPYLQTDKGNVTRILNNLEERKLIYRVENPNDRRSKSILLTESGKEIVPWLQVVMKEWEASFYSVLTKKEIELYNRLSNRIINNLYEEM